MQFLREKVLRPPAAQKVSRVEVQCLWKAKEMSLGKIVRNFYKIKKFRSMPYALGKEEILGRDSAWHLYGFLEYKREGRKNTKTDLPNSINTVYLK